VCHYGPGPYHGRTIRAGAAGVVDASRADDGLSVFGTPCHRDKKGGDGNSANNENAHWMSLPWHFILRMTNVERMRGTVYAYSESTKANGLFLDVRISSAGRRNVAEGASPVETASMQIRLKFPLAHAVMSVVPLTTTKFSIAAK
jgi:hypothetical protein